jgi:subtilisin family serine protease
MTGVNVVLNQPATPEMLALLDQYWTVLDVMPEINALTLRAQLNDLPVIRALGFVAAADEDVACEFAGAALPGCGFTNGASRWNLDAINVTYAGGRTVPYDGSGVYVAILDSGLYDDWRDYFNECSVATDLARCFGGGGGDMGTVSSQPNVWAHDNSGHGTFVASVILGFRYQFSDPPLPAILDGVAPGATIIPVKVVNNNIQGRSPVSTMTRGLLYVTDLKVSGALGSSPLVVNMSWGGHEEMPLLRAAIDYAIANGVVIMAAAGNEGDQGMRNPAAYPEVISAAATGLTAAFPPDDTTQYMWNLQDVPENDPSAHFIAPFSSRALPGQFLDIAAPGAFVPCPVSQSSRVDYSYFMGTSAACPHVAGVAALMLQKNPNLSAPQIESILKSTAMPMPPDCRNFRFGLLMHAGSGEQIPTVRNGFANSFIADLTTCWGPNATGAGLLQADAALDATPAP